jgi:hypothetical protein
MRIKQKPDEKLKRSIQIVTSLEDCIKSIEENFRASFTHTVYSTNSDEIDFSSFLERKIAIF